VAFPPPPPAAPLRLTDRDLELLSFLAEHRFALAAQLARVVAGSAAGVGRRLGALRAAGLVRAERPLHHAPKAWAITRAGLSACDSPLGPPRPIDLGAYRHDVGVGWLAAAAHRGTFGELSAIVSERTMRSEDRRADRPADAPLHGVRLGDGDPGRRHYPDLAVVTASGHRVAFELELSTKSPRHRERILAAYAADRRIDVVVYLVPTRTAAEAIRRSAARVGAPDVVRVQRFRWAGGRAPGEPARGREAHLSHGPAPRASRDAGRGAEATR